MAQSLVEHLAAIVERLTGLAAQDDRLRAELRALAQSVLDITQPGDASPTTRSVVEAVAIPSAVTESIATAPAAESLSPQPLPPLTLGQPQPREAISVPPVISWTTPSDADFPVIEARCRLKAEGCRWAAARRRLLAEGAHVATEIEPVDRDIISRAKALPDCFLWMCNKDGPQPADAGLFELAAACFENQADALSAVKQVLDEPGLHESEFESALDLLAEAQSAIRSVVLEMDARQDFDQLRVFNWLKETAAANGLYIQRHMRMDDPADPRAWPALSARIGSLDAVLLQAQQQSKLRRKLLGKVRHKAALIAQMPDGSASAAEPTWAILIQTVEELIAGRLPPSNRELRDALLPVIDRLPDITFPKGFGLVLKEIDRYFALSTAAMPTSRPEHSPEVQQVARLLAGKSVVMIGGERRPAAQVAIKEAFELGELHWIETRDHQSIAGFEPYIARHEVVLTLLAIRWSSHSFGDIKQFCDKHGKPLVRLPGGYNPTQIAAQILDQCSQRLHDLAR